ncbi:MAG: WecB/TagA/CpsF family glycosyltransferase [bacterium]|nr:WecB/TagA/CpsF family glycosyltransferase [bacterium]
MAEKKKKIVKNKYTTERKIVPILGIKVDSAREGELLVRVEDFLEFEARPSSFGLFIVTPNPEIIVKASKDSELASILNSADLSLPDGTGLIIATTGKIASRVTGIDFATKLMDRAKDKGWKVCLLGGDQNVSTLAKNRILQHQTNTIHENFEILALEGPRLDSEGVPIDEYNRRIELKTLVEINKLEPHLLFVGFGPPKQEKWVQRNRHELEAGVTMVVGGTLDFWAGRIVRAPKILRLAGLEWLWRLIQEPSRWKRQLALVEFVWLVVKQRLPRFARNDIL